ncbi:hypothetical protein C479_08148 [Halovivax asiaticus JCM 14624]|uniref:Uncharacterized protein n=1 Tax=Halovivax asiaticus JCM 14624 TaxID=1227490 RepID=M0BJW1_9EURY|nr:hypothetical protein [Halovivax asiaticus]ELZ10767.1 hypothetical protein C479_08148 [Halovivax asiaticus JCM 14624]
MAAILGEVDTDGGPPLAIPIRHFVVGFGFLLAGALVGAATGLDRVPWTGTLAHVHLLLVGWVCVTIMGAMVQFVPVWSNATLHSRRLAAAQLPLVATGLVAFATALLTERLALLPVGGTLMLAGFWVFAYNIGRTLLTVRPWDVTERHFALALGFFLALTTLGLALAVDFTRPVFVDLPVTRMSVIDAHVTLAIFGAVLTTVLGALYQLGTMFTQTELHGVDGWIRRFETVAYPVGVLALAGGRLFEHAPLARVGGVLVAVAVGAYGVLLARRLVETQVAWTPMLTRYAVVAGAMLAWALLAIPAWIDDPLTYTMRYGAPGSVHLLAFGLVGFVVLGTLYHVVPFIVWVERYSDRLGLEPVPMIDDLYDDRLAAADAVALGGGTAALVASDFLTLPEGVATAGGITVGVGAALFVANMGLVLYRHSPDGLGQILFGERLARSAE